MFDTKKIITLNLLLAGTVGTSLGSHVTKPAWTSTNPDVMKDSPQIFPTLEQLVSACRSYYESNGTLSNSLVGSVRTFTGNQEMTVDAAVKLILSIHPESPILRSSSRVSPSTALTPRERTVISPLNLTDLK